MGEIHFAAVESSGWVGNRKDEMISRKIGDSSELVCKLQLQLAVCIC